MSYIHYKNMHRDFAADKKRLLKVEYDTKSNVLFEKFSWPILFRVYIQFDRVLFLIWLHEKP